MKKFKEFHDEFLSEASLDKFESEYKKLIQEVQKKVPWDEKPKREKEGASTSITGTINGEDYVVNLTHPEKARGTTVTGWYFDFVSKGSPYTGERMFDESGEKILQLISSKGTKPIQFAKGYEEAIETGLIEENIKEFQQAINYLKGR